MGNPVSHSKSPLIHKSFAEQTGQRIHYQQIHVELDEFNSALDLFQQQGGKGLNITLPFKRDAWQAADVLTGISDRAEAVNTMWFDAKGKRFGDTTDGRGLMIDLTINHLINIKDKDVLVLGAGGAVRGILDPLFDQHPAKVVIANRTVSKAGQLVEIFSNRGELVACEYQNLSGRKFNIIINGTAASLQGEVPPVPGDVLAAGACCYDMMYSMSDTPFVTWAKKNKAAVTLDGTGMLVEQAAESFLIWRGIRPETKPVIEMLRSGK